MSGSYDVVGIGHALLDVLASVGQDFLADHERRHGMKAGAKTPIDAQRSDDLYAALHEAGALETPGGSAANTLAGLASFGGRCAFMGKVADDEAGHVFRSGLHEEGIHFPTPPLSGDIPTGRCLILVTPDGERSMNTFIGASDEFTAGDIDRDLIAAARVTYLEGYFFDQEKARQALRLAAGTARKAGRAVALSLSDPFCVERWRGAFLETIADGVDLLFANEREIMALYETDNFGAALEETRALGGIGVLTRSDKGSVIVHEGKTVEIPAVKPLQLVDTTGAGDQYAAGFLYGFTHGMTLEQCGRLGAQAAAEVISHMGPRPGMRYAEFLS